MSTEPVARQTWLRALAVLSALWAVLFVAYRDTLISLADIWSSSETYAHGYVVPLISLWLAWRVRHKLMLLVPAPSAGALLLLAGAAAAWLAGDMVAVNVVTHLAFITLLILTVPAVLGWSVARVLTFPLLFLYFAAPVGDFMLPWLMERTADFTVMALRLSGIPVYREGLQFVIPSGNWSVVEACSGIRYLIASLMVGCLFAYLSYRSLRKRWLFMLVALLVPLLANWLRAYLIVMIGHLSGNELATGVDHLIYGWVFFGVVIMAMLFIGARWADAPEVAPATSASMLSTARSAPEATGWWGAAVAAALLLAPHLVVQGLQTTVNKGPVEVSPLVAAGSWQPQQAPVSTWEPAFRNPSDRWKSTFADSTGRTIDLDVSYYRQQNRERKLVSSSNVLVTSSDSQWVRVEAGSHALSLGGAPQSVTTAILRDGSVSLTSSAQRLRVWRFYWVDGTFTASDVRAKLHGALQLLKGQGDDAAIVAVSTRLDEALPEGERVSAADRALAAFLQTHSDALRTALQATQGGR